MIATTAKTAHGKKYGYFIQMRLVNVSGKWSWGRASQPPTSALGKNSYWVISLSNNKCFSYPNEVPIAQGTWSIAKASALLVWSVISPTMLFITPIQTRLLLNVNYKKALTSVAVKCGENTTTKVVVSITRSALEFKHYLTTSAQKVRERPKDRLDMARASVPSNNIGFLPIWSDIRLQNMTVTSDASWRIASWKKKKYHDHYSNASWSTDVPSTQHNIQLSSHRRPLQKSGATQSLVNRLSLAKIFRLVPHSRTERWRTSKQLHRTGEEGG